MSDLPRYLLELEEALDDLPDAADAMLLSEVDGYIAGIALLPADVPPEEWLPAIWRPRPESPDYLFHDQALLDDIARLATQHFRMVARNLHRGEYDPIYEVDGRNDEIIWEFWIDGLNRALRLRPDVFAGIEAEDEAFEALTGLVALAIVAAGETDAADGSKDEAEAAAELLPDLTKDEEQTFAASAPEMIPEFVSMIYDWTRSIRPAPDFAIPVRAQKVGRNDPCPCGSGKKYKKCCGAA